MRDQLSLLPHVLLLVLLLVGHPELLVVGRRHLVHLPHVLLALGLGEDKLHSLAGCS